MFEISRVNQEAAVAALKRALNYFPSIVNWTADCPEHVIALKDSYHHAEFPKMTSAY